MQHWGGALQVSGLPGQVDAAIARAALAAECAHAATLCTLRCAARKGGLGAGTAHVTELLRKPLRAFAQCFALTPLPIPGRHRRVPYLLSPDSLPKIC
jgi:hypothetical protein